MGLRKGVMSGIVALQLASDSHHVGHNHPNVPHTSQSAVLSNIPVEGSHVHVPEESSCGPSSGNVAEAGVALSRIMEIRTGLAPSSSRDPDSGLLLAILRGYRPRDSEQPSSVWAQGTAEASGSAGHFRIKDETGQVVIQGNITEPNGGGNLTFENAIIVAGGMVVVSSLA